MCGYVCMCEHMPGAHTPWTCLVALLHTFIHRPQPLHPPDLHCMVPVPLPMQPHFTTQGVAEQECRRAADVAEAAYAEAFDENVAAEEKVLDGEHARALGVAKEAYDENAVGDERIRKAHEAKYVEACTAR